MRGMISRLVVVAIAGALIVSTPVIAQSPKLTLPDVANPLVAEGEVGRFGGTYVATSISDPRTFNAVVAQETSSTVPLSYSFDGLVETNRISTEIEGALAESWTVSKDGRTWRFKLRKGVVWHDARR